MSDRYDELMEVLDEILAELSEINRKLSERIPECGAV